MKDISAVFNAHPAYIESLYKSWQANPSAVETDWQAFFRGFDFAVTSANGNGHHPSENGTATPPPSTDKLKKEFAVMGLIHGYRDRGHLLSTTNPIKRRENRDPRLALEDYSLSETDLGQRFSAGFEIGLPNATLSEILARLKQIYTGNIGFENAHIHDREKRLWLREKVESRNLADDYGFSKDKKQRILDKLNDAVVFEQFLHTKFVGQKRFSLEGGESLIPALDAIINIGAEIKEPVPVEEVVIGMAHRGRLNVLANTLGKTYQQIFKEFEGKTIEDQSFGSGDVKYHLGFISQVQAANGNKVYLKLLPNPSHLEAIDPVVTGFARAKADLLYKSEYDRILPVLIHGDAAVAGQGIVYEVIQMSKLKGYRIGGTMHLVINNQIGFTTDWRDGRSSTYCTSVAEVVQAPVFHVNGDDPEAVVYAAELAMEYRQKFNSDVFVDIVCYRKYGHNESDEPRFTHPDMWQTIDKHPSPRDIYNQKLIDRKDITTEMLADMDAKFRADLQRDLEEIKQKELKFKSQPSEEAWSVLQRSTDADFEQSPETGIDQAMIDTLLKHLLSFPEGFKPLSQIEKLNAAKKQIVEGGQIDWQLGELMAYGSLLLQGHDVRMSGQDVRRGTFSHRHAHIVDAETFESINKLDDIAPKQGKLRIFNSLLSEYAVLGFEYGYSLASPNNLVIWEAQFGDFVNGAHSIIDQFIFAGEAKWQRMNGIVMLLPHGYEGQGPEHSSARLERFLQGCAQNNIVVANVTSASNFFHLLRRQMAWNFRKPLIVMSPKSTLRAPFNLGEISEIKTGTRFRELIDDAQADPKKVKRVLVCSGKVYYDLLKRRDDTKRTDVAIVRIEQLYPFPTTQMRAIMTKYKHAKAPIWVQEEPKNMGAWSFLMTNHFEFMWEVVARPTSASPATGYLTEHQKEQTLLVDEAFA
jgi:2-oxoglutarate dehydrogenase E1 component